MTRTHDAIADVCTHLLGALAISFMLTIAFGRMYMGVHSPFDVRSGALIGLLLGLVYHCAAGAVDALLSAAVIAPSTVAVLLVVAYTLLTLVHPRPSPPTPTLMINTLCAGLIIGAAHGESLYLSHPPDDWLPRDDSNRWQKAMLRTNLG